MIDFILFLESELKKLTEREEYLLKLLGEIQLYNEKNVIEELEEINMKIAIVKDELEKIN